jgi:poly(3-hydroxybutyrate) depolymerase
MFTSVLYKFTLSLERFALNAIIKTTIASFNFFTMTCHDFRNRFARIILFLALAVCIARPLKAQLSSQYKGYQRGSYQGMTYGLFKPDHYDSKKSYPLIVYLHGSTDTVSRDLVWYEQAVQSENPSFVLSPKTTEANQGWGNTWEDKHPPAMEKTLSLVDSLVNHYNIDKNRLYIYGISMGGFGVFSVLAKEPGIFAGGYAVCGGSNVSASSKITTPLWIFHGSEDDVVPVRLSKNIYDEMIRQGNKTVRYTEYPGVKHNSWENVAREKTLVRWLLSQKKDKSSSGPDPVSDVHIKKLFNSTARIQWSNTNPGNNSKDKQVWYYKIFRDNELIAEVPDEATEFNDYKYSSDSNHEYYVVAVNYFFKESKPSMNVKLE